MKQARPERPAGDKTNHISRKVLVLERDPFMRQALSQRLHAERYTVLMAATASEAIKAICEQKPDLILLDLGMPERTAHGRGVSWDEFLVISWRGALRPGCCIPFIALSDAADYEQRAQALEAGAADVLDVTSDREKLRSAIERALAHAPQ